MAAATEKIRTALRRVTIMGQEYTVDLLSESSYKVVMPAHNRLDVLGQDTGIPCKGRHATLIVIPVSGDIHSTHQVNVDCELSGASHPSPELANEPRCYTFASVYSKI